MRYNGLCLVIDRASERLAHPWINRYRPALLLGALREDYWYLRGLDAVIESPSLEHFYGPGAPGGFVPFLTPSARTKASALYRRALIAAHWRRYAAAAVLLGRCSHLLTDMGCPVHVHRVAHFTDPYEWYVEGARAQLEALPLPPLPEALSVSQLVHDLAAFTQRFEADKTNSLHGRALKKLGLRRSLEREDVAAQAREIIPMTASYNAALFSMFLRDAKIGDADAQPLLFG